jgi:hypothetical protein
MKNLVPYLAALSAMLMVGCGGTASTGSTQTPTPEQTATLSASPGSSTGGSAPDACAVLTAALASQITGGNATKISGQSAGGVSQCVYADTGSGVGATAVIESLPGMSAAILQAAMAQASHNGSGNDEPVSGIGDQALKEVDPNSATVAFAKGDTLVVVAASSSTRNGAAIESDLESLCRQIAGRL